MAQSMRFGSRNSRQVVAGAATALLHLGLFLVLLSTSGRFDGHHEGETPITQLLMLESPKAAQQEGTDTPLRTPDTPDLQPVEPLASHENRPPSVIEEPAEAIDSIEIGAAAPLELPDPTPQTPALIVDTPATFVSSQAEKSALIDNLARLAEQLAKAPEAQITWEQEGRLYRAALALQPASSGVDFDHAIADVSAESAGRQFKTRIRLKRLSFSHYTQMVDRWDPMVQLHDDEIIGRFHVNSQFNLLYDHRVTPVFLGKVTTAAGSFSTEATGRRRQSEIFRGGIEMRAGRINLPQRLLPFDWAPRESDIRIHEFENDTRIRFFADGSYSWRNRNTDSGDYLNQPTSQPVYFIATAGATLYVQGVVSGKVLIYSPRRIVVESNLTYAHDPRLTRESQDYLGLVSDRYIEIAPPHVTGPGDLEIHGALFAGRRFAVRDFESSRPAMARSSTRRSAKLRIYGSLAAGSVSASEPRYAMRIEYDNRFELQRPPGFPATNRFAAEDWDGQWHEASNEAIVNEL